MLFKRGGAQISEMDRQVLSFGHFHVSLFDSSHLKPSTIKQKQGKSASMQIPKYMTTVEHQQVP